MALGAVIEIGSTGIRLVIAEIHANGKWAVIDHSELPIPLGWDVFTDGLVSRDTFLQCLKILNRFKEQINGWKIDKEQVTVIATSALREARNRDSVLDRIMIKTGFLVQIIDGIEENRLMYIAVLNALEDSRYKLHNINSIIIEVGGGSTELMLLEQGKMAAVHSFRFGSVIIEQQIKSMMGTAKEARMFLEDYIKSTGGNLNAELNLAKVQQFITVAPEVRLVAREHGEQIAEDCWSISRSKFDTFVEEIQLFSIEECIAQFKIPYSDAHSIKNNLLTYKLFLHLTKAHEIIIPETNIREGVIISKISQQSSLGQEDFFSQIVASTVNLGKRFRFDEPHAACVRDISLKLFDALSNELGFEGKERLLLEIAALLHDIGTYIRASDHQLHSQYIIAHSEIFGLSKENMGIISNVVKLHTGKIRSSADTSFTALPRIDRITVLKLAAILRAADALDSSHSQRITDFTIEFCPDSLIVHVRGTQNISREKIALKEKSDLFQEILGYTIMLI